MGLRVSDWWDRVEWVSPLSRSFSSRPLSNVHDILSTPYHPDESNAQYAFSLECSTLSSPSSGYECHLRMLKIFNLRHVLMDQRHAIGSRSLLHLHTAIYILEWTSFAFLLS